MNIETLYALEKISQAVGNLHDMVQGGGGNTSAKSDDGQMAVKASGFKIKQINIKDGYVVVDYNKIREYYNRIDMTREIDFESESSAFVKNNIISSNSMQNLRPSVEAGFHSILRKIVIHTHSVYANILTCSENGKALTEEIFNDCSFKTIWIPYTNPGFSLTVSINNIIKSCLSETNKYPQVIFMENHGLVVTADDVDECIDLHAKVNDLIKKHLNIIDEYPRIEMKEIGENIYESSTSYLRDYFKNNDIRTDFFDRTVLYPDQLVYLNDNVEFNGKDKKLSVNTKTGELLYRTNKSEAAVIEETLLAFIYVVDQIRQNGHIVKTMSKKDIDFIMNWESESYRKKMMK